MKNLLVQISSQELIGENICRMDLYSEELARFAKPGQFVQIKNGEGLSPLLRRPISIADVDEKKNILSLIYKVIGDGTKSLAKAKSGDPISIVGPLGQGFSLTAKKPLLVGGGLGIAPLIYLTRALCPNPIEILLAGRSAGDMFWQELFSKSCQAVHITTDDGSLGTKGTALALLPELINQNNYDCIYTCGPEPMMKAVAKLASEKNIPCQISLEKYMACGLGACLSCSCATPTGQRVKVCTDGPVFWSSEVTL